MYKYNGNTYTILSIHEDMNGKQTAIATKEGQTGEVYLEVDKFEALLSTGSAARVGGPLKSDKPKKRVFSEFNNSIAKVGTEYNLAFNSYKTGYKSSAQKHTVTRISRDGKFYQLDNRLNPRKEKTLETRSQKGRS